MQVSNLSIRLTNLSIFSWIGLVSVAILMPLNWLIEAAKWKFLLNSFSKISIYKSLEAVLSGLTFGFVTPRSIGDYLGRAIFLDVPERMKAVLPTIISRISQLVPTLIGGSLGTIFLLGKTTQVPFIGAWGLILFMGTMGIFIFFSRERQYLWGIFLTSKTVHYQWSDYFRVLLLSFLRYMVFSLQFIIVLKIVGAEGSLLLLFAGVTWIFLVKSILPSFNFLSDLGIREFSAILFFEAFNMPLEPVLIASIFIWVINILFPSILGLFVIGKSKFDLW
jgi:hypothetical protein